MANDNNGPAYRTFMVDPLGALSDNLAWSVQSQLAGLLSPCIAGFGTNWVYFNRTSASIVSPWELLVYFMPVGFSIVKHAPGAKVGARGADISGYTSYPPGASEVYVQRYDNPAMLARVAFHELMHNRLHLNDRQLHSHDGLASAVITAATPYTDENKRLMAAVISKPNPQWTAGIGILNSGKYDQMSEYYQIPTP